MVKESKDQYSATSDDFDPKITRFVNHATGEVVEVDSAKMAEDNIYFTKIIAQLAENELDNVQWKENLKNKVSE